MLMITQRANLKALVATIVILGASACGATSSSTTDSARSYLFERANVIRGATSTLGPTTLLESLPNRTSTVLVDEKPVTTTFSDTVVIGTVSRVEKAEAISYGGGETDLDEPQAHVVEWSDPTADERNILVTLTSVRSLGGASTGSDLTFRLGVLLDSDPDRFTQSAEALGHVAVLLKKRPDGRHQGEWIPALGPAAIGVVADDDTVRFPGMGEREAAYVGGIDTVAELERAASGTSQAD